MDVLTVVTDIVVILGVTVPVIVWAWRKVSTVVADQRREREQTLAAISMLTKRVQQLEQGYLREGVRNVHVEAAVAAAAKEQQEHDDAMRATIHDLEQNVLGLQAAHVRVEGDQKQALDALRAELGRLSARFETVAKGFIPRP